jgi:hypothetical protein
MHVYRSLSVHAVLANAVLHCFLLYITSYLTTLLYNSVILYEMLALDVPFNCRDVVELVGKITKAPPPPLPAMYSSEVSYTLLRPPHR